MIIAVDFDDTICANTDYPEIGAPVPGAIEYLRQFEEAGAQLILWTMRSDDALQAAVEYLRENEIPLFGVNENPEQGSWTSSPKVYAHVYIDDAAHGAPLMTYEGVEVVNWQQVGPAVLSKVHTHDPVNRYGI
jgi:hypothetical protein